jgi:serine/threonine protein kinase
MNAIQQNELKFSKPDWIKVSQLAKELIVRMLDRNQKTRIKAAEILNDKWFADKKPEQETQEKSEAINSAAATFASGNNTENGAKSSAVRFDQRKNSGNANEISEKNELGSTSSAPVKERSLAKFKHTSNYKRSTMLTPVKFDQS